MQKDEIKEKIKAYYIGNDIDKVLDYITNLQEELENLREEDWVWHQLIKMQNAREYRSKFLKEFQEEFGTNTFPDYDEIYKRYDKVKKENKILKEKIEHLLIDLRGESEYKQRNEKAIEYIKNNAWYCYKDNEENLDRIGIEKILEILGANNEEL